MHVQGLEAGTVYHYRLVAVQGSEAFEEPDRTLTTQSAGGGELVLPDGRAWELVSPPDKHGTIITPSTGYSVTQAAADGSGIVYASLEAIGEDVQGKAATRPQILSTRMPGGWRSQDISLPHGLASESESAANMATGNREYHLFSPDLSLAMVEPTGVVAPLSPEASERTIYLRNNENGTYRPLVTPADVSTQVKFGGEKEGEEGSSEVEFVVGTPDLAHVIFASAFALTPEARVEDCAPSEVQPDGVCGSHVEPGSTNQNLYEWSAGRLQLVDVLPNGEPVNLAQSGSVQIGAPNSNSLDSMVAHAFSDDGRWVVWHVSAIGPVSSAPLYVRDMVEGETFELGGAHARFETMSSDGSRVFFLENGELYEFETASRTTTDLTAAHGSGESSAGVQDAVLGRSDDGSYVYFVAKGVLANGAISGSDNLYVLHYEEGAWSTKHVATLSSQDEHDWYAEGGKSENTLGNFAAHTVDLTKVVSRVSSDGRFLAFMSEMPLTGYDNLDAVSGQRDEEVFLYDAVKDRLVCASCNPTGARPVGFFESNENSIVGPLMDANTVWANHWIAASIPPWNGGANQRGEHQPRFLSDSGRLFFNSTDGLVPQDTNGLADVYEYEQPGIGSCEGSSATFSEGSDGCVSLVSSGTSSGESAFMDASENGDDAFFITNARLTAADYDTNLDVYDAHVCSAGAPCLTVPVAPPACSSGDSCKAAPSPQPEIFGPTPSATFSGVGNVVEEPKKSTVKHKAKPKKGVKHKKRKRRKARKARKVRRSTGNASGKGGGR